MRVRGTLEVKASVKLGSLQNTHAHHCCQAVRIAGKVHLMARHCTTATTSAQNAQCNSVWPEQLGKCLYKLSR